MAVGCVANTQDNTLTIDGAGTLRATTILNNHVNNPLEHGASGIVYRPLHVRYGWGSNGSVTSDAFTTANAISPAANEEYGPRWTCQIASPYPGAHIAVEVGVEAQITYAGTANNPFSGFTFFLQMANPSAFGTILQEFYGGASGRTVRRHLLTMAHLVYNDTVTHTVTFRLVVGAGISGAGENVTAQLTEKRHATVLY